MNNEELLDKIEACLLWPLEGFLKEGKEWERPRVLDFQREAFNKIRWEILKDD